ncbi:hypothetical protein NXX70_23440 [Bacteroides fragilis]|nr:hypothetical protein [Bacteroides fragilis]
MSAAEAAAKLEGIRMKAAKYLNEIVQRANPEAKAISRLRCYSTLQISYIGMQTVEAAIKPVVKITLKPDTEVLDEVVVTGYENFKSHSFTEQHRVLQRKNFTHVPSLSVQDKLAERFSCCVQITSTSGQPGAVWNCAYPWKGPTKSNIRCM